MIQAFKENPGSDVDEILGLLDSTHDNVIKTNGKRFASLCHSLTEILIENGRSVCGINIMSKAISKFQENRSHLTPIHSDFCLLCLDSKCLNPALNLLEIDYIKICKTDEKEEDIKHVLLFYYYGGLIYAAIKNFARASLFFEIVLTTPANVMNSIMQDAYKKQIILNLLQNGHPRDNLLPKYTSACVLRVGKMAANLYLKLAHEYSTLNHEKIRRSVTNHKASFERDENMGLIKQCLALVHKRNIQRLTKTFLTLPLRSVANHVGLATEREAELYILNMIDDGEIFARINQKDGMVVFDDNPEKFDSLAVFQKLQEDISTSTNLINTLKRLDAETPKDETKVLARMNSD